MGKRNDLLAQTNRGSSSPNTPCHTRASALGHNVQPQMTIDVMHLLQNTTNHSLARALVVICFIAFVPVSSFAQGVPEAGANGITIDGKQGDVESPAMRQVQTAVDLATFGLAENDPVALVAAARMLVELNVQESSAVLETESAEPDASDKDQPDLNFTPEGLLASAREMAGDNEAVTALIDQAESMVGQDRGRVGGPRVAYDRVLAGRTDRWNLGEFRANERAEVRVRGDGDTDLDCFIYDQNGNEIDSDVDYTDYCILRWYPRWQGPFTLYIRNLGSVYNRYVLSTN